VSGAARRASDSPAARALARAGLVARWVIYILIGWVAILVALGQTSQHADPAGRPATAREQALWLVLLWLLGIGFAGYALWRLSEAAFGVTGEGSGAGPRLEVAGPGAHLRRVRLPDIRDHRRGGRRQPRPKTAGPDASVMHHTGGRWLVGIAGLVIVIAGLTLGLRRGNPPQVPEVPPAIAAEHAGRAGLSSGSA
jgi:hypothetical protein